LQVIGGLILLPIAVKLLVPEEHHDEVKASDNLMGAIKTIIIADAAMGIDNVLAIAGASHGSFLLVAIGFLVSIPIIVGGSTIIGRLMDRFPVILYAGAGLLGWTAGSMIGHDKILGPMIQASVGSWAPLAIQIFLAVGVIAVGLVMSRNVTAKAQG
ncbi:MAG: TerC family protein, partial [Megasphaera sp.]|nr:TerC family protein [Megasphaera sp.]